MVNLTLEGFRRHLVNTLEIRDNDIVFLFSRLQGLGRVGLEPAAVLQAFKDVLTSGALILPTFTQNCIAHSQSESLEVKRGMGALPFLSLNDDKFDRTPNPFFSVNIWTTDDEIKELIWPTTSSAFGVGSALYNLYCNFPKTKVLLLGNPFPDVGYRSTFIHTAQELEHCWYRYEKLRICAEGICSTNQYVRYLSESEFKTINKDNELSLQFPLIENFSNYSRELVNSNILRFEKFAMETSRIVELGASLDLFREQLKHDRNYGLDPQCILPGSKTYEN